ncbi:Retrovirus-related Pol polyprotein from transposon RE2 [Vitis vinifera]|uniref:Retrovirus-related Pol polyprotein from transposon RE2 n=1 Tax=Vitis vinifera TaxID=29760 RepID=A0A438ESQ5_VITVI|nr:Retrovirus-related Pol polyprotein from transposon RE2 [Vitis vinifera]
MVMRSKNGIFKPKVYTVNLNVEEPNAFQEAISHPKWKEAMGEEFRALMKNKTWSLVSLPSNKTFVRCRWVFKLKRNPDGSISRYKARLVAKGYSQSIRQLDVNNAFLNGELQEEVYMDQPPGSSSQEIHELISKLSGLFLLKILVSLAIFWELRSVVGASEYITITRPKIAFSVNKVCQFMQKPLDTHWKAIKRILRYLNGTTDLGIVLKPSETMNLVGFYDADWGSDVDDRRSTSGHCVFLGKSLSLLSELQTKMTMVPVIWCDNISTVSLLANPVLHSKTKHMELDLYFVREKVMERKLVVNHVPTGDQVADVFTKPLSFRFFDKLRGKLTVTSLDLKNGD